MLKLTLLGAPQLFLNGQRISQQITGKHLALLVYLVVTGRPHRRDALAALLWRDLSNGQARKQLSNVLSDLRKQIDPYLIIKSQEIHFDTTLTYWVDVTAFQHYATTEQVKKDPILLQETLALYRGEFLAGFVVRDAPAFEEWVLQRREEFHTLVTEGLLRQTEYALAQSDYPTGIAASNRWLALEPENELAHRQKMRLLAANGQRSAALAQYERCNQILDEEFGVAPSAETNALYLQIKADEYQQESKGQGNQQAKPAAAPPSAPTLTLPHNLPTPLSPFCGRQEELAFIQETLLQPACRFLTITGMGGVGKTRLAQEAAHHLATMPASTSLFADGIFFVALDETATDEVEEDNPGDLYHLLTAILARPVATSEPLHTQIKTHLQAQKMLLVVDNLEHRLDQSALIAGLLQAAPHVKVLATSRVRLNLPGEWLLALNGLPVEQTDLAKSSRPSRQPANEEQSGSDATALFLACAMQLNRNFKATAQNQAEIRRICQLVEGLPLGIELAASWLSLLDCQTIANTLADDLTALSFSRRDLPARHRTLSATLHYSWQLLTNEERKTLHQLAKFNGPFLLEEAKAHKISLPHLRSLADQSLLRTTPDNRYEVPRLMQRYIHEQQS